MNVIGLDLSLTCTGVALPDGTCIRLRPSRCGVERLAWYREQIRTLTVADIDLVVIEDYAFSQRGAHSHELGELGGVVRLQLHDFGVPFAAVVPSSLKKYATGKGNADKGAVLAAAIRRLDYEGSSNDEADALWLRCMGLDQCGQYVVPPVPQTHRDALIKVAWPDVKVAA